MHLWVLKRPQLLFHFQRNLVVHVSFPIIRIYWVRNIQVSSTEIFAILVCIKEASAAVFTKVRPLKIF